MTSTANAYELIGRVAFEWNQVERYLHFIFIVMLDAPRNQADAIYLTMATIAPQRDLVRELAKVTLAANPVALSAVLDLDSAIGKEVGARNATVHSRYLGAELSPNIYVRERSRSAPNKNDLLGKDVQAELASTLDRLKDLKREAWVTLAQVCSALGREMP